LKEISWSLNDIWGKETDSLRMKRMKPVTTGKKTDYFPRRRISTERAPKSSQMLKPAIVFKIALAKI